jgi:hypothetical protein
MDIGEFMGLAQKLEDGLSGLYQLASEAASGGPLFPRLVGLSKDESNHASALRVGKNYLSAAPDLFIGVTLKDENLTDGLERAASLAAEFKAGLALREGLKRLLDLEKRFEKLHLGVSVEVADPSLKKLFQSLTKGDQEHIQILSEMIAGG